MDIREPCMISSPYGVKSSESKRLMAQLSLNYYKEFLLRFFWIRNIPAFRDIDPEAPTHIWIIPKEDIPKVSDVDGKKHASLLGEIFDAANKIAKEEGINEDGFRLVINCGSNGGQAVYHLHMHLLGGRKLNWPPGWLIIDIFSMSNRYNKNLPKFLILFYI